MPSTFVVVQRGQVTLRQQTKRGTRSHRPGAPLFLEGSLVTFSKPMIIRSVGLCVTRYGGSTPLSKKGNYFSRRPPPRLMTSATTIAATPMAAKTATSTNVLSPVEGIKPRPASLLGVLSTDSSIEPVLASAVSTRRGFSTDTVTLGFAVATCLTSRPSSRNRHRTLALKGGVALGCREFLDGIDTRVHTAQFHMAIRVRGDARVGIRRPRAVSR